MSQATVQYQTIQKSSHVFASFCRIGDNVPFAKKGRFGVVHGSVKGEFSPHHILIETGNRDELALEDLLKKVSRPGPITRLQVWVNSRRCDL